MLLLFNQNNTVRTVSMRKISPVELTRIQQAFQDTFFDVCQIGTYSESTDSFGDLVKTWSYGSDVSCGFQTTNGYEKVNGEYIFTGVKAQFRLPLNTTISNQDKIKFNGDEFSVIGITGKYVLLIDAEKVVV